MADNSEPNPTQTEVTSSQQLVGLVPMEGEEQGIGVHLISGENDEDFFGAQAIELNGERHVIVSQAQDPETGELLLVLRGENGEHIAIQSEALSSMVQASGGEHIQVAVETNEEASLTLSSDLSSISHSLSKPESNPLSTTSLSALPSIIANIPNSQTQTTTAPTNVVQAIDTPRVSQEEQPSTLINIAPITTSVAPTESQPMDEKPEPTVVPKVNITENISDKKEEILPQPVIEEEKTPLLEDFGVVPPVEEKTDEKPTISSTEEPIVSQPEVGVKESNDSSVKTTEISNPVESEVIPTEPPKKLETETPAVVQTNDKKESNENTINTKLEEPEVTPSVTLQSTETPLIPKVTDSLQTSTSDQMTTNCLTESITTVSSSLTTNESTTISSTVVSPPEEKVSPPTESVNSVPDLGFGNTAVIQVQDSGNDSSIEQLMANAVLTSDGNYVLMAQTEDGHMTGLPSELNLSDVINAGAAGGQTFLIETPEGLVACTASTSAEDGSIQLIPTDAADLENAVMSSAQTPGTSVESQIIQAISGGQSMSYSFNSSSGCLELTAVNSNQNQTPPPKPTRGGRGSRSNKSKTVSAVPSMGQTLLLTAETETTNPIPKPSTQTTPRSRGGRGKGNRITGANDSSDSIVSNTLQSKINSKSVTNEAVKSITTSVNSLTSEVSAPPGPSQLAASRRTYSKKSNIVWITPDASQGANNTTFATVATASVKPSNEVQKQKATTNCNSSPTKTITETSVSRVRTPSPTKTIMTSIQSTTATKSHAITSIRSASPTKTVAITLQTPSTINKTESKTPSKTTVTTIANKSTPQTISIDKKEPTVTKISATHTATKTVTTSKTAAKGSTQTVTSRGQTPNLTIQSPVTPKESPTKTTIRMSDITATKTSVDTTVPKGSAKAVSVASVPTVTKTRTPVMKSGAQTIASVSTVKTTAPTSPTKTVTQLPTKKTPIPISTSAETSVSPVKKPISNISIKSPSNPIIAEVKDTKSLDNTIKESNVTVSAKPTKTDSTPKTVSTPIAVKSNAISAVSSTKTAAISAEKTNKKSTEKTISNRNVETRHSARLSPSKTLKPEINTKEIDSTTKLEPKSSDSIDSKIEPKSIETQNSKNKSEVETVDKNKSAVTQIESSIQKPSKTEEKKISETENETTESAEDKSVRKSRRSSRNTTNTEENKKEVKTIEENKIIETKTKDTKEIKDNKEKPKETQAESVSTRRTSRKRENTIDDKTEEPSKVSQTVEKTTITPTTTPIVTEVKPQRTTRASTGKKTNPKQTKAEEIVPKTIETKAAKEVENKVETKAEAKANADFDRIMKETTPKEKRVDKTDEKSLEINDNNNNNNENDSEKNIEKSVQKTDLVSPKTSETPSLTRSVKKRVQFEIKEKTEEPKVSKSSDSKEKVETPTSAPTSARTRRSLRSSTPQVVIQSKSEPKAEQKEVSDNNNETKSEKQNENNNNKTPQRFSTRKRKEVTKSAEIEVKDDTKGSKKSKKSETINDIESTVNVLKAIDSTDSSSMSRSANRRSKSVKRFEPRTSLKSTVRHSIETDSLARLNRAQSSVHSFIDDNEWPQKEEEMRRKTISSLSDLRSPNECYDYSTNECSFYIRHQSASLTPKQSTGNYLCQKCGFHTTRINNLVIHHRDQCSYVKNQVIQQWQTEIQKRVRPSDTSIASTSSPEIKRRKTDKNDELNNISDKNTDQSDDDSEDEEITTNDAKSNQNPTISDIDAMLMGSDDEDLLSIDNIEKPKRDLGFSEDDIVWVETNSTHWPAIVSKVFPKEKKAMIRYIDSPWSRKSVKADISSISLFDSAEVNKQYLREGRKASNGDLLVKAVQKAEEFLRKKCLGNELSAAKFFDQIDSDLSEPNADEDERLTGITSTTKDNVSVDFKETAKTSKESLLDTNKTITGSNGDDSEADQMPESNEAIAQWKEKRRQQNAKLLQCIKEGKVETHLLGVYRETIPSERHQKFRSGSETEKNQLKHVPWFGPIDDEEQQEEIYDYCSQLFKSNFKTDGSFDTVAYIFEVWVPEAIVKAISRVRRIELKDSEFIFAKGVILSKTEKDELTKEIQKEAEKQMTSQTSSD